MLKPLSLIPALTKQTTTTKTPKQKHQHQKEVRSARDTTPLIHLN
jgi:hypothetical protein